MTIIRYTQQKWHPLIPFEDNGTLQKWHMTKTPPETDKYDTHNKWCFTKTAQLAQCKKNAQGRLFAEGDLAKWFLKGNT